MSRDLPNPPSSRRPRWRRWAGLFFLTSLLICAPGLETISQASVFSFSSDYSPTGSIGTRAGGGQHYSGGSRSSSSSSSRSYSSGGSSYRSSGGGGSGGAELFQLFFWIFRFTFRHPLVMIPLWMVLGFVVYRSINSMPSNTTSRGMNEIDRRRLQPRQDMDRALAQLKASDPQFNDDAFFEKVKRAFLEIQEGWHLRNLERARVYMSDGVFRRFTTLLDLNELQGIRNALANITVISARLQEVTTTEAFDCLTVKIYASIRDTDVPVAFNDELARQRAMAKEPTEFVEFWTFVRRRGAQTKPGQDVSQGKCPNCGAPFSGGAANKCEYCGAIVNSGAYDWVLSEITQQSEYMPHDPSTPGFATMLAKDPDAAAEILRDRGSLLFWKWLEAWARMDPTRVQKLATSNGLSQVVREIEGARAKGDKVVVRIPAVGGAAVAAIETNVGGYDRVHIDVRWSAILATEKNVHGKHSRPYRSIVTMVRSTDAKTDKGVGLANERCGNCHAPLTNSDSVRCDYCGHDLASASMEWQLEAITPFERWTRPTATMPTRSGTSSFAVASERQRLMQVMVAIVKADGIVDASELDLLKQCSQRWNVPWKDVEELLESFDEEEFLRDLRPQPGTSARGFVETLIAAAKVDGRIDRRERMLIYRAGTKVGLPQSELDELIARA